MAITLTAAQFQEMQTRFGLDTPTPDYAGCNGTFCNASFGLKGRDVQIGGDGEGLDHPNKVRFEKTLKKTNSSTKSITVLPKWHEKVDPTQSLLNSFILPEDSPEIKGIFNGEIVSSSVIKPMENTL